MSVCLSGLLRGAVQGEVQEGEGGWVVYEVQKEASGEGVHVLCVCG